MRNDPQGSGCTAHTGVHSLHIPPGRVVRPILSPGSARMPGLRQLPFAKESWLHDAAGRASERPNRSAERILVRVKELSLNQSAALPEHTLASIASPCSGIVDRLSRRMALFGSSVSRLPSSVIVGSVVEAAAPSLPSRSFAGQDHLYVDIGPGLVGIVYAAEPERPLFGKTSSRSFAIRRAHHATFAGLVVFTMGLHCKHHRKSKIRLVNRLPF